MPELSTERIDKLKTGQNSYFAAYRERQAIIMRSSSYEAEPNGVVVCRHFGCGTHLSLIEQLAGDRCLAHSMLPAKPDLTRMVSY